MDVANSIVCFCILIAAAYAVKPSHLACEACHGVVSEIHERLGKAASGDYSARVPRVLSKICQLEHLVKYIYSPPKMVRACEELLKAHKTKIQDSLVEHFKADSKVTANELEEVICFKISESCKGVKKTAEEDLRKSVQADHVLKPGGDQKIVLEQDGEKIIPKVTDADSKASKPGKKDDKPAKAKATKESEKRKEKEKEENDEDNDEQEQLKPQSKSRESQRTEL